MKRALFPPPARDTVEQPGIGVLLRTLDQAFRSKAWHGSTLRGALSRVGPEEAAWRPTADRHNIWEITVHCAYWKYIALRRLAERPPKFPLEGSDWFPRPETVSQRAWWKDLQLLDDMHAALRTAVEGLTDADLATYPKGTATSAEDLIRGVAFHDTYHCGQIQLLKRMYRARDHG